MVNLRNLEEDITSVLHYHNVDAACGMPDYKLAKIVMGLLEEYIRRPKIRPRDNSFWLTPERGPDE